MDLARSLGLAGQNLEIVQFLSAPGASLTSAEALFQLGVGRFGARVDEIRQAGIPLADVWVTAEKAHGRGKSRFKRYSLPPKVAP